MEDQQTESLFVCDWCEGKYTTNEDLLLHKISRKHLLPKKRPRETKVSKNNNNNNDINDINIEDKNIDENKDRKEGEKGRRKRRKTMRVIVDEEGDEFEEGDDEKIECVCTSKEDVGFMICCDLCGSWSHGKCVGLNKHNSPQFFHCIRCFESMIPQYHENGNLNVGKRLIKNNQGTKQEEQDLATEPPYPFLSFTTKTSDLSPLTNFQQDVCDNVSPSVPHSLTSTIQRQQALEYQSFPNEQKRHINCPNCPTLLRFPRNAKKIRCPRCKFFLSSC